MNEYDDYLIHFGVKGMKWGVRKDKYKSADKATRKKYRDEYKKTDEYKKKVNTAKKVASVAALTALGVVGGMTLTACASQLISGQSIIRNIETKRLTDANTGEVQSSRTWSSNQHVNSIGPSISSEDLEKGQNKVFTRSKLNEFNNKSPLDRTLTELSWEFGGHNKQYGMTYDEYLRENLKTGKKTGRWLK